MDEPGAAGAGGVLFSPGGNIKLLLLEYQAGWKQPGLGICSALRIEVGMLTRNKLHHNPWGFHSNHKPIEKKDVAERNEASINLLTNTSSVGSIPLLCPSSHPSA